MYIYVLDLSHACRCDQRMEAQRAGTFIYSVAAEGFIFTGDCPKRKNNAPFVWMCCPYCGGDLLREP